MGDFKIIQNKLKQLKQYIERDVPRIIGSEAVIHFKNSFQNEGFTDQNLQKWKSVKRADPQSTWYGFKYGSKTPKPSSHPSRKDVKKKYKARKKDPITNYSPAARKWKILKGATGELMRSISFEIQGNRIIVYSDKEYAEVQNKGGQIKVFGKKNVTLAKRRFMGPSRKLKEKIEAEINSDINKILR